MAASEPTIKCFKRKKLLAATKAKGNLTRTKKRRFRTGSPRSFDRLIPCHLLTFA
jgi:hypothetical protein